VLYLLATQKKENIQVEMKRRKRESKREKQKPPVSEIRAAADIHLSSNYKEVMFKPVQNSYY
jgi:hypothetical protein